MSTHRRSQIVSFVGISLVDQRSTNHSVSGGQSSGSQNFVFNSTQYLFMDHPPTPGPRMNPVYEQSAINSSFGPHRSNVCQSGIYGELRREIADDVKRKETIRRGGIKYKKGERKYHPKKTTRSNPQDRSYQKSIPSTSTASVQQPSITGDRSNRDIYINENVSDYDNDNTNTIYGADNGMGIYSSNEPSQEHLESIAESDVLFDKEDLESDDDYMPPDEQKELFDLLKNRVNLTPEQSYILGYFYESGIDVEKDYKQAFKHYKYASDNGDVSATCNLGYLYENGYNNQGVKSKKNYTDAFKLYTKAAQQGSAQAQYNLATLYERGFGAKKDIPAAINFYRLAADQDHHEAQANLAYLELNRNHCEKAYEYYLKATEGRIPRAFFALGYLYQFGKGVKKNHQLAQSYYQEALNKGYLLAKENLEIMEKNETSTGSLTVSTDDANHYDEYFNFGDACLGGINRVQDIGSAYSYYDSEMKHSHGKGSIERGLAMYYQYCRPGSDEFERAFNLYLLSIEYGHIASYYFLGVLLLQNRFFKAARVIFEKLLVQKPQNVSYLFVENEDEFMNQNYPVPRFTTITEQRLFSKTNQRHQQSLAFERIEEQRYNKWSPLVMDII